VNLNPRKLGKVANDDQADWREAWALFNGSVAYVWHASLHTSEVKLSLEASGFGMRSQIVWAKDRFAFSRGHYHWQHEPCWYAVRGAAGANRTGDRKQSTVWTIPARGPPARPEDVGRAIRAPVAIFASKAEVSCRIDCALWYPTVCFRREEGSMTGYFRRQLADYVEYHRDPWNCILHVFGIILLFLAAVLPLTMWPISVFGVQTTVATLAVLPVLTYWLVLDAVLGIAIAGAACLLLWTAGMIVDQASSIGIWITTAVLIIIGVALQIIGHRAFERRQPALVDNPSHLLLGPMFVMAKLFVALGLRDDLAGIIGPIPRHAPSIDTIYAADRRGKPPTRS
jgi:uncharacterized membrane protein YGL010W